LAVGLLWILVLPTFFQLLQNLEKFQLLLDGEALAFPIVSPFSGCFGDISCVRRFLSIRRIGRVTHNCCSILWNL